MLTVRAQTLNEYLQKDLKKSMEEHKACQDIVENNFNLCIKFPGESFKLVYILDDFFFKDLKRYLAGTEITKFLETSSQWQKSGVASDREALNSVQNTANGEKAVVAVHTNEDGFGQIALILPGTLI